MRTFRGLILAILVVAIRLFMAAPALAQGSGNSDSGVGVGALFGLARATERGSDGDGSASGPMLGIWFGGNRNGRVGFMGELSWMRLKETVGSVDATVSFLEIPAVFTINFGDRSREGARVYAVVGPVFDFKVGEQFGGIDTEDFKGVDIGLLAGIGVEVNRIGVEVRGNWGMRNIAAGDEVVSDLKKFTLQILGKFRFN